MQSKLIRWNYSNWNVLTTIFSSSSLSKVTSTWFRFFPKMKYRNLNMNGESIMQFVVQTFSHLTAAKYGGNILEIKACFLCIFHWDNWIQKNWSEGMVRRVYVTGYNEKVLVIEIEFLKKTRFNFGSRVMLLGRSTKLFVYSFWMEIP